MASNYDKFFGNAKIKPIPLAKPGQTKIVPLPLAKPGRMKLTPLKKGRK